MTFLQSRDQFCHIIKIAMLFSSHDHNRHVDFVALSQSARLAISLRFHNSYVYFALSQLSHQFRPTVTIVTSNSTHIHTCHVNFNAQSQLPCHIVSHCHNCHVNFVAVTIVTSGFCTITKLMSRQFLRTVTIVTSISSHCHNCHDNFVARSQLS